MDAYIIASRRSAVGKAPKGSFRFTRPDDLAVAVIRGLLDSIPQFDKERIDDIIVGNATPEAEQGLNVGRMISLMALDTEKVPGMTVNRFCSSGLEAIAIGTAKIRSGLADCIIAGGVECMSPIPFGGWRITPNPRVAVEHPDWYWNMGLTAEEVAAEYNVKREDQDAFALSSHQRAISAIDSGLFKDEIVPVEVKETYLDAAGKQQQRTFVMDTDEGPRRDSNMESLARLKPVFKQGGSVTAGNSSQTSDGASFVLLMSEKMMKELGMEPVAQLKAYAVAGCPPRVMGMGPVNAVPAALKRAGMKQEDIDLVELNEAFASQSLAVIRELGMDREKTNVNGGAIAMGHPLGCTGAKLTTQILHELKRRNKRYGVVTMCIGTGQGAAGIFEMIH